MKKEGEAEIDEKEDKGKAEGEVKAKRAAFNAAQYEERIPALDAGTNGQRWMSE